MRVGGAAAREKRRGKVRKSGTKRPQSGRFVTDDTYLTACSRFRESARLGKAGVEVEGVSGMCSWEFGGSRRRARGARGDHRFFLSYTVWAARPRGRASLVTQYGFLSHTRSSERASLVTQSGPLGGRCTPDRRSFRGFATAVYGNVQTGSALESRWTGSQKPAICGGIGHVLPRSLVRCEDGMPGYPGFGICHR